ncbi:hypothetical protein B0A49_11461 [Cryomyces minteri]|uniref:Uncharacterized protein n=1 Tax=Cryomyces minteri TaxID=331657 RepID=A0A4U0WDB1_9PEZI|nr:hypothetical protein B0A49_11461 [Cryomyces minteri]
MAAMAAVFGTATIPLHVEMCTSLLLADVMHLDSASIVNDPGPPAPAFPNDEEIHFPRPSERLRYHLARPVDRPDGRWEIPLSGSWFEANGSYFKGTSHRNRMEKAQLGCAKKPEGLEEWNHLMKKREYTLPVYPWSSTAAREWKQDRLRELIYEAICHCFEHHGLPCSWIDGDGYRSDDNMEAAYKFLAEQPWESSTLSTQCWHLQNSLGGGKPIANFPEPCRPPLPYPRRNPDPTPSRSISPLNVTEAKGRRKPVAPPPATGWMGTKQVPQDDGSCEWALRYGRRLKLRPEPGEPFLELRHDSGAVVQGGSANRTEEELRKMSVDDAKDWTIEEKVQLVLYSRDVIETTECDDEMDTALDINYAYGKEVDAHLGVEPEETL